MSDDLSLEQRLVLQLSAAINHEEEVLNSNDPQQLATDRNLAHSGSSLGGLSEQSRNQLVSNLQTQLLHDESAGLTDLSSLISSMGLPGGLNNYRTDLAALQANLNLQSQTLTSNTTAQLFPTDINSSLGSNIPFTSNTLQQNQLLPNTQFPLGASSSTNLAQPDLLNLSSTGAGASTEQQISADALISSLLNPNSGGLNLLNVNLNNINLKDISLETLNFISNTLGSNAAKQTSSIGAKSSFIGQSGQSISQQHDGASGSNQFSQKRGHIIETPSNPQLRGRTQSFIDHIKLNNEIQAALNDSRLQLLSNSTVNVTEPATDVTSHTTNDLSLNRTQGTSTIDPDVSTIQNVLQSLLGSSQEQQSLLNTQESTDQTATAASSSASIGGNIDLTSLGLGSEDQSLIDSLKSIFDGTIQKSSSTTDYGASHTFSGIQEPRSHLRSLEPSKSKRSRASTYKSTSYSDNYSRYKYQTDYTTADADTLRAIQQALLGALNPSTSSSTSLIDALNHSASDTSAQHASGDTELFRRGLESVISHRPSFTSTDDESSVKDSTQTSKQSSPASHLLPGSAASAISSSEDAEGLSQSERQRLNDNKRKIREENAARKRRWREVNLLQNRDNDLRARILKRAVEIYGQGESPAKSKWVEDEFERRRQRRLLRAGINSIVENVRARQAKDSHLSNVLDKSHPGYQHGTLSQQSRQAASSHLSQLFKSSNAALEHICTGKLPVPLVPYMLVPFPKRPSYNPPKEKEASNNKGEPTSVANKDENKISHEIYKQQLNNDTPKLSEKENDKDSNEKQIPSTTEKSNDESTANADKDTNGEKKETMRTETSVENSNQTTETDSKSEQTSIQENKERDGNSTNSKDDDKKTDADTNKESETVSKKHVKTEISINAGSENTGRYFEASDRPKHRYTLIGDVRLGVPPNLAAIYHRLQQST